MPRACAMSGSPQQVLAPFALDSATSKGAAREIEPHLERLEFLVLVAIEFHGGLCAFEIERELGLAGNTVRPRLVALCAKGLIRKTDESRVTPSGRRAVIYKATG